MQPLRSSDDSDPAFPLGNPFPSFDLQAHGTLPIASSPELSDQPSLLQLREDPCDLPHRDLVGIVCFGEVVA
ncbi:hypothetical protein ASF56_24945 [Methylobacterium sp. Leaf122]|nr:hypothetical protein ASF56_24945 [Methylobacterium sp. Leaf122]